ncbi:sodium:solute symporter family protein [Ancylomarina longa]|uniref:Sodium:solute symporter family protein n=1 Tax=Ancylomarina longa TaxID=2487017 RepID=A0A434AZN2_9BACT|nr:sodium:solute symporter family protein [Ancylomarina longa]RUT79965.1 sodium:solute symporter family protein [Ancylomarina longa]
MNSLQYLSLTLLVLYFVGIMIIVLRSKASENTEDYFLAGRQLPFWALSITFIASWWGGGSAIDLVDHGFNQGISSFWIYGMPVLFSTFLMYLFSKAIRKIGTITQPQLMEERYNKSVALLLSILILIFMTLGVATQAVVIGNFFQSFFDVDYKIAALIGTGIVLTYSFFGGFKGVVLTDIIQFVFLLIAAIVLFIFAYNHSGGFEKVRQIAVSTDKKSFFSFFHNISNNFVFIITFGCSWMIQANIWQRISATKTPTDAKRMMLLAFIVFIPLYLIVTLTGMLSIALFDTVPEGGIVPAIILNYMPTGLAALLFVGLCSAIMSTMDSMINTGALVLSVDIYKHRLRPNANAKQMVWTGKIATLIISFLGLLIALEIRSILKISWIGSDFLATGAFVPLILGFIWKKGNSKAAATSLIFGLLFSGYNLAIALGANLPSAWEIASVQQASIGMSASSILFIAVSLLTKPEEKKATDFIKKAGMIK